MTPFFRQGRHGRPFRSCLRAQEAADDATSSLRTAPLPPDSPYFVSQFPLLHAPRPTPIVNTANPKKKKKKIRNQRTGSNMASPRRPQLTPLMRPGPPTNA